MSVSIESLKSTLSGVPTAMETWNYAEWETTVVLLELNGSKPCSGRVWVGCIPLDPPCAAAALWVHSWNWKDWEGPQIPINP